MNSEVRTEIAARRVREIVAAVLEMDPRDIDDNDPFYEGLSANSLEKVEIAARVEREFGISLTAEETTEMASVARAVAVLEGKGAVRGVTEAQIIASEVTSGGMERQCN